MPKQHRNANNIILAGRVKQPISHSRPNILNRRSCLSRLLRHAPGRYRLFAREA